MNKDKTTNPNQIKIEKNIPMPDRKSRSGKYPFGTMEVGDSFFVPDKKPSALSGYCQILRATGLKFSMRSIDGGVRVWRTE